MEVPYKISGEQPVISVSLSNSHDNVYKNFRCPVCGKIAFSYDNTYIRSITPSGDPVRDRPTKIFECGGSLPLYVPDDLYNMLHHILDVMYATDDIDELRTSVQRSARNHQSDKTVHCRARFFLS